ncbi:hypothetical protein HRbin02_01824 [Candidatus Calditenuaceae archaeon HR02]|nr:hypothetical protein HRbin02_01824 [Candidatus Calditenuaceae archaeon HR02]
MAHYLVKAKMVGGKINELRKKISSGYISSLKPFGRALEYSLVNAGYSFDGYVMWEEEDYCSPPLATERQAVLDHYFIDLSAERVREGMGWRMIMHYPNFWLLYEGLPRREGERPLTRREMPHQQISQNPSAEVYNKLADLLFSIPEVQEEASLISVPGARALWLSSEKVNPSPDSFMVEREFAHLHPPYDGSMHLMAPPNWVDEILGKGWGERHPLAGHAIPRNAVMVYAPRNEHEVKIVHNIVLLSYWRAKGERIPSPRSIG